jgi:hypothetical protein
MANTNNRSLSCLLYNKETSRFEAAAFALFATINACQNIQKFVVLNACYTKLKYLIMLIIVVRINANNNTIPLA